MQASIETISILWHTHKDIFVYSIGHMIFFFFSIYIFSYVQVHQLCKIISLYRSSSRNINVVLPESYYRACIRSNLLYMSDKNK